MLTPQVGKMLVMALTDKICVSKVKQKPQHWNSLIICAEKREVQGLQRTKGAITLCRQRKETEVKGVANPANPLSFFQAEKNNFAFTN